MTRRRYDVEWTEIARQDLDEIVEFVFKERPAAALQLIDFIEEKATSLDVMPERGRMVPEIVRYEVRHYRELIISHYRLVYRIRDDVVFILGLFDSRRNLEDLLLRRLLSSWPPSRGAK